MDADYEICNHKMDEWVSKQRSIPNIIIATGFIARDRDGRATTLRRNGSDYSATIMGAILEVSPFLSSSHLIFAEPLSCMIFVLIVSKPYIPHLVLQAPDILTG